RPPTLPALPLVVMQLRNRLSPRDPSTCTGPHHPRGIRRPDRRAPRLRPLRVALLMAVPMLAGSLVAVTAPASAQQTNAPRPNILWLSVEDLSPRIGAYGDPIARTPTIDRLAAEGMRFTNAFVTLPICAPARSAIITGM